MDFVLWFYRFLFLVVLIFVFTFCFRRNRRQSKKRRGKKRFGFFPSGASMGNALQTLHAFVQPRVGNVITENQKEEAEEDEDGGSNDPVKHLLRQLKPIRNGEVVDRLTALKPPRD
jgi:hypothetical protein